MTGHNIAVWPDNADVKIECILYHAKDGMMSQKTTTNMHCSRHMDAAIHVLKGAARVRELPIDRFLNGGDCFDPKTRWEAGQGSGNDQ
ncbi:MAG: cyclase family protein [Xanthobacteraceae bacterium]